MGNGTGIVTSQIITLLNLEGVLKKKISNIDKKRSERARFWEKPPWNLQREVTPRDVLVRALNFLGNEAVAKQIFVCKPGPMLYNMIGKLGIECAISHPNFWYNGMHLGVVNREGVHVLGTLRENLFCYADSYIGTEAKVTKTQEEIRKWKKERESKSFASFHKSGVPKAITVRDWYYTGAAMLSRYEEGELKVVARDSWRVNSLNHENAVRRDNSVDTAEAEGIIKALDQFIQFFDENACSHANARIQEIIEKEMAGNSKFRVAEDDEKTGDEVAVNGESWLHDLGITRGSTKGGIKLRATEAALKGLRGKSWMKKLLPGKAIAKMLSDSKELKRAIVRRSRAREILIWLHSHLTKDLKEGTYEKSSFKRKFGVAIYAIERLEGLETKEVELLDDPEFGQKLQKAVDDDDYVRAAPYLIQAGTGKNKKGKNPLPVSNARNWDYVLYKFSVMNKLSKVRRTSRGDRGDPPKRPKHNLPTPAPQPTRAKDGPKRDSDRSSTKSATPRNRLEVISLKDLEELVKKKNPKASNYIYVPHGNTVCKQGLINNCTRSNCIYSHTANGQWKKFLRSGYVRQSKGRRQ